MNAAYMRLFDDERALANDVGYVDRSDRGVVRIAGLDRLRWLHDLTTQDVAELQPWRGAETLILSPQGHVQHHIVLTDDGNEAWCDVEPGTVASLVEFLDSMRFMLRVETTDVSDEYALLSLVGPRTPDVLSQMEVDVGTAAYSSARFDGGFVRRMPWPDAAAADVVVPRRFVADVCAKLEQAGARRCDGAAFEALRVVARRPRLGHETDHRTIPHEVGWIGSAVHLDKGCYRGQETVARVHNVGRPPRVLVFLSLPADVAQLPASGEPVVDGGGATVGFVGTSARHYELGAVALALVKRSARLDGLTVGDSPVLAEAVVSGEPAVKVPKLKTLRR